MKRLISTVGLCLLLIFKLSAQKDNSLLWKISTQDGQHISYLFGTYHLIGADYLADHQKVNKAYKNAERVVVETILDSSAMMMVSMKGLMMGNSLKRLISDSTEYQLVKTIIEAETGMGLQMLDQVKPIVIATMYSVALAKRLTPKEINYTGDPIDMFISANAMRRNVEVITLESALEQAEILFNSQTLEEQAEDLVELATDKDKAEDLTLKILEAYRTENISLMGEEAHKMEEAYGDMDVLLDNRNLKWVTSLKPLLNKGNTFIAVGALHLPGEKGLIQLLEKEGYTLSPVF
jgi:hypothetical protein